jgi:hypothetical protein
MSENSSIVIYQTRDGNISFNVNVFEETVWLSQKQMAELFDRDRVAITQHISNIFKEGELEENSVCKDFLHTAKDGKSYKTKHYNLDVIISVGYRVKSQRGIQFRQWATKVLKQYLLNGYSVNETRIKKIESSLDELVSSHKLLKEDVDGIKNLLLKLIERPIVIHNHSQLSFVSSRLENKLIELLDQIIESLSNKNPVRTQIKDLKSDIQKLPTDEKAKNRLVKFLKDLGDSNSDTYKLIKGAGVAKKIISELVKKLGELQDLF